MDLWLLKPGHKIKTHDGSEAEVLSETEDGQWIRVKYLEGEDPLFGGTEDLVSEDEVESLLGTVTRMAWGDKVTVIVHLRPEDQDFEGGYEATTLTGVPYNVTVTGEDESSAADALSHLLGGLEAFGFRGRVAVEDATVPGQMQRYEVDVSDG